METIVCLVPDTELEPAHYIPKDKTTLSSGFFQIFLQSSKTCGSHRERVITISHAVSKQTRAVVHLQLLGWPGPDLPPSPAPIIDTALALLALHKQQRVSSHPVLVHCIDGGSKSGTFTAVLSLLSEMETSAGPSVPASPGFPDVVHLFGAILGQRKGIVRDKEYMNLVYEILLYYIQDTLMKQGILTRPSLGGHKTHNRHPSQDFILGPAVKLDLSTAGSGIDLGQEETKAKEEDKAKAEALDNTSNEKDKTPKPSEEAAIVKSVSDIAATETPKPGEKDKQSGEDDIPEAGISTEKTCFDGAKTCFDGGKICSDGGIPDDLSKLADINLTDSPAKRKITKEDFMKPCAGISGGADPLDPLSQLDPLWSLK